jgi:ferrochelatase
VTDAILLLAYGGPDSPADIAAYLSNLRGGRPTPPALLAEITRRYELIGGRSPLLEITRRVADKLAAAVRLPVYVGMRHWHPLIRETVAQMAAAGVQRCTAICMAPHTSRLSTGAYRARLDEALAAAGNAMAVDFVESWHTAPAYLDGLAANVRATLARFDDHVPGTSEVPGTSGVKVIFTAHSLPAAILAEGDPYDRQLDETARLVAARLGLPEERWTRCYQSAAQTGAPWLGPQIEEVVPDLAAAGERNLVVAPIGFIADHVEILYDLDIGLQAVAVRCGARVERTPMLNDTPPLIAALAEICQARKQDAAERR